MTASFLDNQPATSETPVSIIIAELVTAQERLTREYPDVPRPDPADPKGEES